MGLDMSHNCWHGSYSGFEAFRNAVAIAAKEHYDYTPDYDRWPLRAFQGWWDNDWQGNPTSERAGYTAVPFSDPLDVFFIHSDCDGYIFPQHARLVADRLEPLVGYLNDEDVYGPQWTDLLRQFITGLRDAAENGDVVDFH